MLTKDEIARYSRHLLLEEVGKEGQEKLKAAKVLVVGAGGLGCPALQYLAGAGIGTIGIIDHDTVSESNLQRQVLFGVSSLGKNKAEAAKERLEDLNPAIQINTYPEKLTVNNALHLFKEHNIIVDGTDNFATRYLVNDAAVLSGKPVVYGSIFRFEGQVSVFNYMNGPSYRCLFPDPPLKGSVPNCSQIGVLGVLPGIIGSQQANETLKLILGIGEPLAGKLLHYDAKSSKTVVFDVARVEAEVQKVLDNRAEFQNTDYEFFCDPSPTTNMQEIAVAELQQRLAAGATLLDVRELHEEPKAEELKAMRIPLGQIAVRASEIAQDCPVIVLCQHGIRSKAAISILEEKGFSNLINLIGGIAAWEDYKETVGVRSISPELGLR